MTQRSVSIYGIHFDARGKVLLAKDANSHLWGFPGGGVEPGESHADTLHREFLEETRLSALGDFTYIAEQNDDTKERYFYAITQTEGALAIGGNGSDIEGVNYFNISQLPLHSLAPGIETIIKQYRKRLYA